ncbi:MAG: antibiotic biosynthesis monooxygenase [Candidatus Micrarchaeota archaeon]
MIARVAFWKLKPGKYADFFREMSKSAAILQGHAGIKGIEMLHSVNETNLPISITYWDTLQDSDNSRNQPEFQAAIGKMKPILEGMPEIKIYDVDGLEIFLKKFK